MSVREIVGMIFSERGGTQKHVSFSVLDPIDKIRGYYEKAFRLNRNMQPFSICTSIVQMSRLSSLDLCHSPLFSKVVFFPVLPPEYIPVDCHSEMIYLLSNGDYVNHLEKQSSSTFYHFFVGKEIFHSN